MRNVGIAICCLAAIESLVVVFTMIALPYPLADGIIITQWALMLLFVSLDPVTYGILNVR